MRLTIIISLLLTAAPFIGAQQFYYKNSCTLTDRHGTPLRSILSDKGLILQPVSLNAISPRIVLATIAAEDKRFFDHNGVDVKAIARAGWQNLSEGAVVSGASTITQQLVRAGNPRSKTMKAKIKEAFKAVQLEDSLTKDQIMEAYLNTVSFGSNIHGVQAAAQIYFNTSASQLSLSQSAFLAGIIKSPLNYNPYKQFKAAMLRRDTVLNAMLNNGYITQDVYDAALAEKLTIYPFKNPFTAPHYSEFINNKIKDCKGTIQTTIDGNLQGYIEKILPAYLAKLKQNKVTNAAAVVLDNNTGQVLAMAGSADYFDIKNNGFINGAIALRQPGSALKPFVYALAFDNNFLPGDTIADEDKFFGGFRPRNYDEDYHGMVTIREALGCSYNIPAVAVAAKLGTPKILNTLKQLGFASLNKTAQDYGLGIALGNGEVKLLELANAYRALANGGLWRPVQYTLNPLVMDDGMPRRVFSQNAAYMASDILSDNNARAAAFGLNSPLNMPFVFAAKTGTTKDYRDNIAAGYTPSYTIAVWTGNFDGKPMQMVSGITGAAPLLKEIAVFLNDNYTTASTPQNFARPQDIVYADICPISGFLISKNCAKHSREIFAKDTVPNKICGLAKAGHNVQIVPQQQGITFPQDGDVFRVDPATPLAGQQLAVKHNLTSKNFTWYLNDTKLDCGEKCFWPIRSGVYKLKLTTPHFKQTISFKVL